MASFFCSLKNSELYNIDFSYGGYGISASMGDNKLSPVSKRNNFAADTTTRRIEDKLTAHEINDFLEKEMGNIEIFLNHHLPELSAYNNTSDSITSKSDNLSFFYFGLW